MEITQAPVAKAEMLIRRPVAEVFEAFVDPVLIWAKLGHRDKVHQSAAPATVE